MQSSLSSGQHVPLPCWQCGWGVEMDGQASVKLSLVLSLPFYNGEFGAAKRVASWQDGWWWGFLSTIFLLCFGTYLGTVAWFILRF